MFIKNSTVSYRSGTDVALLCPPPLGDSQDVTDQGFEALQLWHCTDCPTDDTCTVFDHAGFPSAGAESAVGLSGDSEVSEIPCREGESGLLSPPASPALPPRASYRERVGTNIQSTKIQCHSVKNTENNRYLGIYFPSCCLKIEHWCL